MVTQPQPRYGWRGQATQSYCEWPIGTRLKIGDYTVGEVIEYGTPPPTIERIPDLVHLLIVGDTTHTGFMVGDKGYWSAKRLRTWNGGN